MSIHTKHALQETAYIVMTIATYALIGVMLAWRG
jgi:hypothetical protein